jgi:hypothetical protein
MPEQLYGGALYDQVKAAFFDTSLESYELFKQLSEQAMETMEDDEWDALYAELMGGKRYAE